MFLDRLQKKTIFKLSFIAIQSRLKTQYFGFRGTGNREPGTVKCSNLWKYCYTLLGQWQPPKIQRLMPWLILTSGSMFFDPLIFESRADLPPPRSPNRRQQRIERETEDEQSRPLREYTFEAPESNSQPTPTTSQQVYRVEVFSISDLTLSQVRQVEPRAFRKGEIIQVGIFQQRDNAYELVQKLTSRGLWVRIIAEVR